MTQEQVSHKMSESAETGEAPEVDLTETAENPEATATETLTAAMRTENMDVYYGDVRVAPGDGNEVVTTVDGIRDARPALALDIKTYHTSTLELAGTITGNRLSGTTNIVSPGATVTNNPDGSRTVDTTCS